MVKFSAHVFYTPLLCCHTSLIPPFYQTNLRKNTKVITRKPSFRSLDSQTFLNNKLHRLLPTACIWTCETAVDKWSLFLFDRDNFIINLHVAEIKHITQTTRMNFHLATHRNSVLHLLGYLLMIQLFGHHPYFSLHALQLSQDSTSKRCRFTPVKTVGERPFVSGSGTRW